MPRASIIRLDHGITAIDAEYARPLADASHLIVENGRAAFVDTGANNAVPLLLDALAQHDLEPDAVDFVFLTHVHLDHAGGAGQLMQKLPAARCVVHPRGAVHMIDPTKLIAGTEAVYGKEQAREMYGTIEAIAEERVVAADDEQWFELAGRRLQTLYTEGHARHHYVLNDPASRGVFTGDSFGLSYRDFDTEKGPFVFPTTTPIDFDPEAAHVSVDRIMGLEPERVYLTHYSEVTDLDRLARDLHADIDAFSDIALAAEHADQRQEAIRDGLYEHLNRRLDAHGFSADAELRWSLLEMDVILNAQGLDVWLKRRQKAAQQR
ncbi:MAG: MBL fold metallo-hydrolase [Woeseiaceae bacterium]|nr:MBL fold metallo-hydrolase [Woeseiaceae bacterium]